MTEKDVESQIQTPAVLKAFKMVTLSRLPEKVKSDYDADNAPYDLVSEDAAWQVAEAKAKGRAEGEAEGKAEGKAAILSASELKQLKIMSDEDIANILKLTVAEVAEIKLD